jgi:hypothetical protein
MTKKTRVNVYLPVKVEQEINYLANKYGVSAAYVLQCSYKLCDHRLLEKMLSINLIDD